MKYTTLSLAVSVATALARPQLPGQPKYRCDQGILNVFLESGNEGLKYCNKIPGSFMIPIDSSADFETPNSNSNSEQEVQSTGLKFARDVQAEPKPACQSSLDEFFLGEFAQISSFCRDIVGGETVANMAIDPRARAEILGGCRNSEDEVKTTCQKFLSDPNAAKPSARCNEEINSVFEPAVGIPLEQQYIPWSFCADVINGKSINDLMSEGMMPPFSAWAIRNACESSEEVIKATCQSPSSVFIFPGAENAAENAATGNPVASTPVAAQEPPTCQLNGRNCEWVGQGPSCLPTNGGNSQYDASAGRELVSEASNQNDAPSGQCQSRFGTPCSNGAVKQLWCDVKPAPDCQRDGKDCFWIGQAPFCPAYDHDTGKRDKFNREYITGLNAQGFTRNDPKDDCRQKAGDACRSGYKQLWCRT